MSTEEYQILRDALEKLYVELGKAVNELHPALSRLHRALGLILGKIPAEEEEERREIPLEEARVIEPEAKPPEPSQLPTRSILIALAENIRKLGPFTDHVFTVVKPLSYQGGIHDLGTYYDSVVVVPSIDAQIEFDRPVETKTPVVLGQTAFNVEMRVRRIHFKAISQTLTGTLSIWAFRVV